MPTIFEPAAQNPGFDVLWQQWLARLRNTEQLLDVVNSNSSLGGDFDSLEDVVTALVTAVGKLNTVVNTTSLSSDYSLSVNESAVINITAADTPLNIAVGDGMYVIDIIFDSGTFAADQTIVIMPNGSNYTGEFTHVRFRASTSIATDEVDTFDGALNNHRLAATITPYRISARLIISGTNSVMTSDAHGTTSSVAEWQRHTTAWDNSTAHTSLGTLSVGEVATGTCYVRRMA